MDPFASCLESNYDAWSYGSFPETIQGKKDEAEKQKQKKKKKVFLNKKKDLSAYEHDIIPIYLKTKWHL